MTTDHLRAKLREHFRHDDFREGQLDVIEAILAGRDAVAVMPTGGGKSLLYQLPALLLPGVTLVVSPLIALMKDQVDQLESLGLPASFINSTLDPREQESRMGDAASGKTKLLYLAPERFKNQRFRAALSSLRVALLAIDEAHCISEWGHDFRPDYRKLGEARALLGGPPVVALTATATPDVRDDIVRELGLDNPFTLVTGFERKNLRIEVVHVREKAQKLREIEATMDEAMGSGIVYVASRKSADEVAAWLTKSKRRVGIYHAGLSDADRSLIQDQFMASEVPYIVATNAFGMGIDKGDIRFVVHYEFPKSLEAYYQEIGRAGRDGQLALTKLLFTFADKRIQEFFIDGANPSLELVRDAYRCILKAGEATTAAIAAALRHKNDFAVASAVSVLERASVVKSGHGVGRGRLLRVVHRVDPDQLPIDGDFLTRKLESDRRMLDAVIQFAYHTGCRKERLLAYFGDTRRHRTCDACDRCLGRADRSRELGDHERATATACIDAARLLDKRMGLTRLAGFLLGDNDERLERLGAVDSPLHGALKHLDRRAVLDWLDALLDSGYLEKVPLDRDGVYVIHLSTKGRAALVGKTPIELAPPAARGVRAPRAAGRTRSARARSAPADRIAADRIDAALLERLKRWRTDEAQRRKVPAYVVFHNRALEAIAATRPTSKVALGTIPGIGTTKLESYGDTVLEMVRLSADPDSP